MIDVHVETAFRTHQAVNSKAAFLDSLKSIPLSGLRSDKCRNRHSSKEQRPHRTRCGTFFTPHFNSKSVMPAGQLHAVAHPSEWRRPSTSRFLPGSTPSTGDFGEESGRGLKGIFLTSHSASAEVHLRHSLLLTAESEWTGRNAAVKIEYLRKAWLTTMNITAGSC